MSKRRWYHVSLARKIGLLFGAAVLLVIGVTLWSPFLQMDALNAQTIFEQAQRLAAIAHQSVDLRQPDWENAQRELGRRWPLLSRDLELKGNLPRLIPYSRNLPPSGFRRESMMHLADKPHQTYFWKLQDEGRKFRFAMAVRGTDADPYPSALRGIIDVHLPMQPARGTWNKFVTVLAGASGAVLAILVFYMVTQRLVLSPVHDLRRSAEQVALGNTEVRSSIVSGDEFQKLSDTFNEMLTHLCAAQEQQEKINRSLDIKLGELAETNVALYESNRLKGEFLANVTHELRTPLVSIIGFAELLHEAWDSENPDRRRLARYSNNILTSGRSLLEIINDLLDLVKIEAGKMSLHITDFSLGKLCDELIDFVRPLADKRKQSLVIEHDESPVEMHSDAGKIKQILYNLLSNAIKFTPEEGSIKLSIEHIGGQVHLIVSDTGPGIPEEARKHIFEKFRQLDSSKTREYEGTGLGLAITRELVGILGGEIEIESDVGDGAKFIVALPLRVQRPEDSQRDRDANAKLKREETT
ncbi:MAG: sensor histidine kinase [Planctomycetota bacterium]|jgi:signal transduction histidine kinase